MEVLTFKNAPQAVGPYSIAVKSGNLIFFSGQLPIVSETGELIVDDIEKATERILLNLSKMLEEIGLSMKNVVKSTIFTTKLEDFAKINEIYKSFFKENYPARSAIGVAQLPKGATIEMEFVVEV